MFTGRLCSSATWTAWDNESTGASFAVSCASDTIPHNNAVAAIAQPSGFVDLACIIYRIAIILVFEGYGLQPVHSLRDVGRASAPEGTSCGRLSSPQRLKPVHLGFSMYGLKAVPFKSNKPLRTASSQTAATTLRPEAIQVIQHRLAILGAKLPRVHGLLNIRLRLLERHELLQLSLATGLDTLQ